MKKLQLLSFADSRYRASLLNLEADTRSFPFTNRIFMTEKDLSKGFIGKELKPWLYRRGYGYWRWKSYLVHKHIDMMDDGDILFYSDAGIRWNKEGIDRFNQYIEMLNSTEGKSLLVFRQPYIIQEWTKGDVLHELGVYDDSRICSHVQFLGGLFAIKKNKNSSRLVEEWDKLCQLSHELITDKKSKVPNKSGFKEHRHDQSIFAILALKQPHIEIDWSEVYPLDGDWGRMNPYPIWCKREKELHRSFKERIRNKILRPWREILHIYFKYFRHYEYLGRYTW